LPIFKKLKNTFLLFFAPYFFAVFCLFFAVFLKTFIALLKGQKTAKK
jgi:hypothetical protein